MSDKKYVGSTAAAKLVSLVKSALKNKADNTNATASAAGLMSAADKSKLDGIAEGATRITVDREMSASSANPVMNGTITVKLSSKADKTDLGYKLDKAGGTVTGDLTVNGDFNPFKGLTTNGLVDAQTVRTPVLTLHDNGVAGASASINVSGVGAVEVTVPDGDKRSKALLKIGTPTDADTDAAANVEYVKTKISEVSASGGVIVDTAMSNTSTNPVQNKVVKSALDGKLDKTGGTLTGNLTGKYITGTWLQSTAAENLGKTPGKIAVLDDSGWVYYRTPGELLADIGAATVSAMLDKAYPVGSIYMSVNSTDPKTLFGGTWVQIKDRFLLAAGTTYKAGATGGEAEHTLTTNEMPNHEHSIWFPNDGGEQSAAIGYPDAGSKNTYYAEASKTSGTGGGAAHNNMPPYLAVYVWKRTA